MSSGRPPPGSIPTLTEVVSWPAVVPPVTAPAAVAPVEAAPVPMPMPEPAPTPIPPGPVPAPVVQAINEVQLQQRVLADIQKQVDLMLDVRLREALAPALARATDALVRDARKELASTLRDIVAKAVEREIASRNER